MANVSFVVHSYNEAAALTRLVESSLPFTRLFNEWVILDHRSNDDTQAAIDRLAPRLAKAGIRLVRLYEGRDLSADCTFADVRNKAFRAATNRVAVLHDADFILGVHFGALLRRGLQYLGSRHGYYGAAFTVPVVWDRLVTNAHGHIRKHGRIWVHSIRPRILLRDAVHWEQTGKGGLVEVLVVDDPKLPNCQNLTADKRGALTPHTVVSVNVKPARRIAMRETMTMFMQGAVSGTITGGWVDNFNAGTLPKQPPYKFKNRSLIGWRLYAPNLRLVA